MGASSVTGVGQGSADKAGQKGSEHLFVGVEKLIGPRIVHAGRATLNGASPSLVVVTLPVALPGLVSDYVVLTTTVSGTGATHANTVSAFATSNGVTSFQINSLNGSTDVVQWVIVRVDNATAASSANVQY